MAKYIPRKRKRYDDEIVAALKSEFDLNRMEVPRLQKIVVNMGLGDAVQNSKLIDAAAQELGALTGQKAVVTGFRVLRTQEEPEEQTEATPQYLGHQHPVSPGDISGETAFSLMKNAEKESKSGDGDDIAEPPSSK